MLLLRLCLLPVGALIANVPNPWSEAPGDARAATAPAQVAPEQSEPPAAPSPSATAGIPSAEASPATKADTASEEPLSIAVTYAAPPVTATATTAHDRAAQGSSVVRFSDRPFALHVGGGFGSIVGNGGALLSVAHDRIGVVGGAGWSPWGMQWGAALRGRLKIWERRTFAHAFTASLGFTTGPWKEWADYVVPARRVEGVDEYEVRRLERAYWVQVDLGYELRMRSGLSVMVGPGTSVLLNPGDCQGDDRSCKDAELAPLFPLRGTFSVFGGYAF